MAFVKLKNVRLVYPRFFEPNEDGKYSVVVLVPQGSEAAKALQAALMDAWSAGRAKFGAAKYCENPTGTQIYARSYIKTAGGLDTKGNPVPDWYEGFIGFNASTKKPVPVIDRTGAPVVKGSPLVYSGAQAMVTVDVAPVEGGGNFCIGRYLRCVMMLEGGDPISVDGAAPISATSDFADDIDTTAGTSAADYDAFDQIPW